jgi:hypothetical protein
LKLELANFQIVWIGKVNYLVELVFGENSNYHRVDGSVFANHLVVDELFEGLPNGKTVIEVFSHYLFGLRCRFLVYFILHLGQHVMLGHRTCNLTKEITFCDNGSLV